MSFYTSLSGLRGAQTELGTISNNIANVASTGFKRSRAQFGDLLPPTKTTAGAGVRLKGIEQEFTQGGFASSARELDLAISGPGFIMTRDALTGGTSFFTRNGSLAIDSDRYLVDSNKAYVQILPVDPQGNLTATGLSAARNLQLPLTSGIPQATTLANINVSLPSAADKPASRSGYTASNPYAFDPTDPNSYNYAEQTTVYDSAGSPFAATMYFVRTGSVSAGDPQDTWQVHTTINNQDVSSTPIDLAFDATGNLTSPTGPETLDTVTPVGAASPLTVALDFTGGTQMVSGTYTLNALTQDGLSAAKFQDLSIQEDGLITATFADGTTKPLGRLLLANFANPAGLRQRGDARWTVTGDSGPAQVGTPGADGLGRIQSGALEQANVDLTEELVSLIAAQRNFQANAKAIETANAMTQSIINLQ